MYHFALISCFKVEAVDLISEGKAPRIVQPEEGATYDKIWKKKDVAKVMVELFVVSKLVTLLLFLIGIKVLPQLSLTEASSKVKLVNFTPLFCNFLIPRSTGTNRLINCTILSEETTR